MSPRPSRPRPMSPRRVLAAIRATLLALGTLAAASGRAQAPDWSVDPAAFERSMNVVGAVRTGDGAPVPLPATARVAAFAGTAVRGVAAPVAVGGEQRFFLTAYGSGGETLTFRLYDGTAVASLAETTPFAADAIRGTVAAPFVWTGGTSGGGGGGGAPGGARWRVDPSRFGRSMGVVAAVRLAGGARSTSPTDTVAAFVGGEVRGVAAAVPTPGGPAFFLTVYGRAEGEPVTFRVASGGGVFDAAPAAPVAFASDGVVGATADPLGLAIPAGSSPGGPDDPAAWAVNPAGFEHALSVVGALTVGGVAATHPADRVAAFVGGEVRGVAAPTLVGGRPLFFLAVYGRAGETVVVKGHDGRAGRTLAVDGSFAFEANAVRGTLAAPVVFAATGPGAEAPPDDPAAWAAAPATFEATMSAVGTVDGPAPHPASRVAALSGDEARGVAAPISVGGRSLYFLTTHGARAGETLRLAHFDGATGRVYDGAAPLAFAADAVHGTVAAPVVWTRGATPSALYVYPGDADEDGTVDQSDLLPLALFFGLPGPARSEASAAFAPGLVRAWAPVAAAAADADGDGTVDQNDLLPLGVHFGRTRPADSWPAPAAPAAPVPVAAGKTAGPLRLAAEASAARVAPGDTFAVVVRVDGAGGLHGVGAALGLDPAAFEVLGAATGTLFAEAIAAGHALRLSRPTAAGAAFAADAVHGTVAAPVVWTRGATPSALYVYPGDADEDGTVDQSDLLPLALFFGLPGPARSEASAAFAPGLVRAWAPVAAAAADADGDGTVDQNDLLPLGVHFGRTRPADSWPAPAAPAAPVPVAAGKTAGPLRLAAEASAARVAPGDTFAVVVRVDGAGGLHGVGAALGLDPAAFEVLGAATGTLFAEAIAAGHALRLSRPTAAGAAFAATLTEPAPLAATGTLVRLRLRVRPGAAPGAYALALVRPAATLPDGTRAPVETAPATVEVTRTVAVAAPAGLAVRLDPPRPNPARGVVTVPYALAAAGPVWLEVVDVLGRRVRAVLDGAPRAAGPHAASVDAAGLPAGLYVVRLRAGGAVRTRALVVR